MARLRSEDTEYQSYFELDCGKPVLDPKGERQGERWQYFSIRLVSGKRELHFKSDEERDMESHFKEVEDITRAASGYLFCRSPKDEVRELVALLERLAAGDLSRVVFEPAEPSFELRVERQGESDYQVNIWVDEGNVETSICRWDAIGIRFFSNQGFLLAFIKELAAEFAC